MTIAPNHPPTPTGTTAGAEAIPAFSSLRRQLGTDWHLLHPNIQERFARDPMPGANIVYEGRMEEIRCSRMGKLFAQLTRVIGNPLTPHQGRDVPMRVELIKVPGFPGVCWQRTYFYPRRKPYVVISVKKESAAGELMECVGGGFGMLLDVYAKDGSLHFESTRYFFTFFGRRVPLPHWLAPGRTHVIHEDLGGGDFRFTISMVHGQLGETFYQTGVFRRAMSSPAS
ncbi:MAG TPA: DUF4166 domain-containing protein [Patescibacteria group bacterium]|nr:DUF4166 domain-containing protein [Patescibacteria group bacterium]